MKRTNKTLLGLGLMVGVALSANAAVVFQDDFSSDGALAGSTPDLGSTWAGGGYSVSSGAVDLTSGAGVASSNFTTALSAGNIITVTVEVSAIAGGTWGGVSLFTGADATGTEILLGQNNGVWGVDVSGDSGNALTADTSAGTVTFTYNFDSGDFLYTSPDGSTLDQTAGEVPGAGSTYQSIRIHDGNGQHNIESVIIDISAVPEPSSMALLGLGGLALFMRRRK